MCTLVVVHRPAHRWPLLVAANRDEMHDRPWTAPGRHWPDRPEVVAGRDALAGGSWLGVNDHGMVAAVMNRQGTLGPVPARRSRGELVLEALDHGEVREAAAALADLEPGAYRAFNLFVGDPLGAFWVRSRGEGGPVEVAEIPPGVHMLTAADLDDEAHPRVRHYLPRFRDARIDPPADWGEWPALLGSREHPADAGPEGAMNLDLGGGFGTVCSHLVAIPRYPGFEATPRFLFAAGPPDTSPFEPVAV